MHGSFKFATTQHSKHTIVQQAHHSHNMSKQIRYIVSALILSVVTLTSSAQESMTSDIYFTTDFSLDDSNLLALSTSSSSYSAMPDNSSVAAPSRKKGGFNSPKTNASWGISAGYVSKQWEKSLATGEQTKMGLYNDSWLHGIQLGIRFNPLFKYGFGLDMGLFYEYYHNRSSQITEIVNGGELKYFKTFSEHALRLPIHLEYRLNFSKEFQIFFYGGAAAEYILSGSMSYTEQGYQEPYIVDKEIYGTTIPSAKRYNVSASFGGGFRFGILQFNVGTEMGLIDVSPSPDYVIKQHKPLHIMLSVMF